MAKQTKTASELSEAVKETLTPPKRTPNQTLSKAEREILERLKAREVGSQWWQPVEDGDYISGVVTDMREQDSQFKEGKKPKKQTVLTLDRGETGSLQVTVNVVLANEIKRLSPRNGDRVLICYRGKSSGARRGKPANLYTMEIVERAKQTAA